MKRRRVNERRRAPWLVSAALAGVVVRACSPAAPPEGLSSVDRFQWSQEKFDTGSYGAAARGYQDFIIRDPLNPLVDSAQFMLGESYLRNRQELLAVGEFERLATTRPNSPVADDAQFGACRALWALSPKLPLDQDFTRQAIAQCTRLLEFFPASPLVESAETIIEEANAKLAAKDYEIGIYYFRRRLYESANIYFEYALSKAPPRADLVPEILFDLHRSYTAVGFLTEALTVQDRLFRDFPDSPQAQELRSLVGPDPDG
jgi:outer membrane protein assembly factor BamD